jgi:hypothetical protein
MKSEDFFVKMNFFLDFKNFFGYKAAVLIVLLLLSFGILAKDLNLAYLPPQAVKAGDNKYQLVKDFDTSVKQMKGLFVGDDSIKDELMTSEENYQVHVFYNLKKSAPWHRIYIISWDDKVFARISK